MKGKKIEPFEPKTPHEKQLVELIKGMVARISEDGFSEWHAWAHRIGEKGKCPNSSPFIPFLRGWVKADKKNRLPILLAAYRAYAKSVDPFMTIEMTQRKRRKT